MERNGSRRIAYLALEQLATEPELARRLPSELALRYHALPLAEEGGRVTVALADPGDEQARTAVLAALGPDSCVIRGDPVAIDARLAEVWGEGPCGRLRLQVCAFPQPVPDELWSYAQSLGTLLGAPPDCIKMAEGIDALTREGKRPDCDLVIVGEGSQVLMRRLRARPVVDSAPGRRPGSVPFAVLAAEGLRWPLQRLLLVLCGQAADDLAVDWALRLACPSRAIVTALVVLPPVPATVHGLPSMEQSLASVLAADTPLGCQMRRVAARLVERQVGGTLCLRQGAPDQQIRREMLRGDYDLVAVASKSCRRWLQQPTADPICALQDRADRPVLFVEPTIV